MCPPLKFSFRDHQTFRCLGREFTYQGSGELLKSKYVDLFVSEQERYLDVRCRPPRVTGPTPPCVSGAPAELRVSGEEFPGRGSLTPQGYEPEGCLRSDQPTKFPPYFYSSVLRLFGCGKSTSVPPRDLRVPLDTQTRRSGWTWTGYPTISPTGVVESCTQRERKVGRVLQFRVPRDSPGPTPVT